MTKVREQPPEVVIAAIYRAVQAPALWPDALAAVARAVNADAAAIHAQSAAGVRRVLETWGEDDERPGRVSIVARLGQGGGPGRPDLFLTLARASGREGFGPGERRMIAAMASHLRRAVRLVGEAPAGAGFFRAAFGVFTTAAIVCEQDGRIVYANPAAERWVSRAMISLSGGRLELADPAAAEPLARALAGGGGEFKLAGNAPCLAIVAPLAAGGRLADVAAPRRSIVYLVDGRLDQAHDAGRDRLMRLYGLTPTEAAIAVSLIQGRSVRDIATARGSTTETVRSQVKLVLHKTGSPRQADLFRLQALLQVRPWAAETSPA